MERPSPVGVTDPELAEALASATCIRPPFRPEDRATCALFEITVDGVSVGHAWRPDAATAHYLWRVRVLGRRH